MSFKELSRKRRPGTTLPRSRSSDKAKRQASLFPQQREGDGRYHHRGRSFVCRSSDIGKPIDEKSKDAERQADAYSGDLILPPFMVGPSSSAW